MVNQEIADIFDHMSRVLAFKGKDRFRALAYERAAGSLRGLDQDVTGLAREKKLKEIPGVGHDLSEMIEEYKDRSASCADSAIRRSRIFGAGSSSINRVSCGGLWAWSCRWPKNCSTRRVG